MTIFRILLLTFLVQPTFAQETDLEAVKLILEYQYGNQITGSYLKIYADGYVEHSERICCPPSKKYYAYKMLSKEELEDLVKNIELASKGELIQKLGSPTNMGSSAGFLEIIYGDYQKYPIHIVERDPIMNEDARNQVTLNTSPAAMKIEELVLSIVNVDIRD